MIRTHEEQAAFVASVRSKRRLLTPQANPVRRQRPPQPIVPRQAPTQSLLDAAAAFDLRGGQTIVEIGWLRHEPGTPDSVFYGESVVVWEKHTRARHIITVDIEPTVIERTRRVMGDNPRVRPVLADGVKFFETFNDPIDLLYLDAWDVILGTTEYQRRHGECFKAAMKNLHERSLVLIDDADFADLGKAKYVIQEARNQGFELWWCGRQAMLGRGERYNPPMPTPEVWLALPSANPAKARACNRAWQEQGYRTAFLLNGPAFGAPLDAADMVVREREYRGWGNSINHLCTLIDAPIVVGAGDDMTPHPTLTAGEIGRQFIERFPDLMGVMQPTGDRWGDHGDGKGALADRICGSPWMGRAFIERWNGGNGPFWNEYFHFYADEEMKVVTERAGILWQRPHLIHDHDHWMRNGGKRPHYMKPAQERWNEDKAVFQRRAAAGFHGCEPLTQSTCTPARQASLRS